MFRLSILPLRQACQNLIGHSDDPEELTGEVMNEEQFLLKVRGRNKTLVALVYHLHSWLSYMFGSYESASRYAKERQATSSTELVLFGGLFRRRYVFVEGLIAFAMAHKTDATEWKIAANESIKLLKNNAAHAPSNFQHMLLLLQAESAFLAKNNGDAAIYYDGAIEIAAENGYVQDEALASERAGIFHLKRDNTSTASHYYGQAHNAYLKWGAKRKASHLRLQCPF
mmetsp:Transcript_34308/g.45436  ORF Transcript_34308/g.45436 Transcript_34308/m.45436 type:complete len:227 (+) Transcript_34308:2-682(+)